MTPLQFSGRKPYQNQWLEAVKTAGCGLALALGFHTFIAEVRYIPSESMAPTLQTGDRLIIEKLSYLIHPPQRGDIVVFKAPAALEAKNFHGDLIKRIVGLPGDRVQVKGGRVWINGMAIAEPYLQTTSGYTYGPAVVPNKQYFVLGDNRNRSYDSHFWGFVSRDRIVGHAVLKIYPLKSIQLLDQ